MPIVPLSMTNEQLGRLVGLSVMNGTNDLAATIGRALAVYETLLRGKLERDAQPMLVYADGSADDICLG